MARKVNTKFVIGLSVTLFAVAGIYGTVRVRSYYRNRNPEVFKQLAAEAEKAGKKEDAANFYFRTAVLLRNRRESGADEYFSRAAEIFMDLSKHATTQEMALRAYNQGKDSRKQALLENPRNKQVNAALLEDDYKDAQVFPSLQAWTEVENVATSLIKSADSITPRLYRAEARLQILMIGASTSKTPTASGFQGVDDDIKAALAMEPESGRAVALAAMTMQTKAIQGAMARGLRTIEEFEKDTVEGGYVPQMKAAEAYLRDYLAKHEGQPDVAFQLANHLRRAYDMSGRTNTNQLEESITYAKAAVDKFEGNIIDNGMADLLIDNYLMAKKIGDAENVYRTMIDKMSKDDPIGHFALGQLYVRVADYPKAIEAYKEVIRRPKVGIERDAVRYFYFQWRALERVAWLNMELVERDSNDSANPARLKEAAELTEKLRTSHPPRGIVELLDGRAHFIGRSYPEALKSLRTAESNIASNRSLAEDYRRVELMLARLNQAQGQLGGALDNLDKALELNPNDLEIVLQKATLLVRLGQFEKARFLLTRFTGPFNDVTKTYANQDRLPPQFMTAALNIFRVLDGAENKLADSGERDSTYYLQLALKAVMAEDYEQARDSAMQVLAKEDKNTAAFNQKAYEIAISANVQLKDPNANGRERAKELAAKAVEKFPTYTVFRLMKTSLDKPAAAGTAAEKRALFSEALKDQDPFILQTYLASTYSEEMDWDNAIKELIKAEEIVKAGSTPDERERLAGVIDRIFSICLTAANATKGTPRQEAYYNQAQTYVTKAEKLNQDGTNGLLYRGRLEFLRSDGKKGMEFLRQAVAAHPDYAVARMILGQAYLSLAMTNAQTANTSGTAAAQLTSNKNAALEEFRQVLHLAPDNLRAIQMAVELLLSNGDSTSVKEAEELVKSGLRLAPQSAFFLAASEILSSNLKESIERRQKLLKDEVTDAAMENRLRLAVLYVRQKDELGTSESLKKANMAEAVSLVRWIHEHKKNDLRIASLLAAYLVEEDHSKAAAAEGLKVFDSFIADSDPDKQYNGLIAKGEFLHKLEITRDVFDSLRSDKLVAAETPLSEAVLLLKKAIALKRDRNEAERHLGDLYFDLDLMKDALEIYTQVLKNEKDPTTRDRVQRRSIEVVLRQEVSEKESERAQLADAIKKLDEMIKSDPRDVQALVLRAFACIRQKPAESDREKQRALMVQAMDYLNKALTIDSSNPDALYYRALTNVQTSGERLDDAIKDLTLSLQKDKKSVKSQILLAEIYRRSQRYEQTAVEYAGILDLNPDMRSVRVAYADFLMGMAQLGRTFPAESSEDFVSSILRLKPMVKLEALIKQSSEKYPNDARWHFMYAQLLALQGQNDKVAAEQSLRLLEALYQAVPGDGTIIDAYLTALHRAGNYQKIVEIVSPIITTNAKFIEEHPETATLYLRRAAGYRSLGKEKEAIDDIDKAMAVTAGAARQRNYVPFIMVVNQTVDILAGDGTNPSERTRAQRLVAERLQLRLAADEKETISKVGLMQMYLLLQQPEEALKIANSTTLPTDDKALRLLLLRQRAMVKYQAKQYDESEKDFKILVNESPNDIESLNNYAFMLADGMNRGADAVKVASQAIKVLNTEAYEQQVAAAYASLYDTLGWSEFKAGNTKNAIQALQRSLQTQPSSDAYYHLAMAYQKDGNIPAAKLKCTEGIQFATKRKDVILSALMELQAKL